MDHERIHWITEVLFRFRIHSKNVSEPKGQRQADLYVKDKVVNLQDITSLGKYLGLVLYLSKVVSPTKTCAIWAPFVK